MLTRRLVDTCIFGAFILGVVLSFGSISSAENGQCEDLFESIGRPNGILEMAIERHEANAVLQRQKAAKTLADLDLANDGWWPLEARLLISIEIQLAKFRDAEKAALAAGRQQRNIIEIRRRLQMLLRPSTPFRMLTPLKLRALVDRLMNESDLSSPNAINSVKDILYRSMYFDGLNDAPVLRDAVKLLDAQALLINQTERQRLPKMRTFVAARGAKDLPALVERRDALVTEIKKVIEKTKPVPDNVIDEVISLAHDFRTARVANKPIEEIVARWKALAQTDVFFAGLADGDAEAIGFEWTKVTTPENTIKMFVMNTSAGSPTLALRLRDLDEINRALKYLARDPL